MDIAAWLEGLALGEYAEAFRRNHVTPDLLGSLADNDLKEIGVTSLGHRRKLLAAIAALSDEGPPESPPPAKEQRHVAILFADLTDFTGLSQRLGAERLHDLASRYAATSGEVVVRFGGTVDKHIGDAVMALFGAPVAHGDDALRAVRCALGIHAAVNTLGREFDLPLSAHIGIAIGDVIAGAVGGDGQKGYTVLGDAVNRAARLAGLAGPGETIVDSDIRRAVEPAAVFNDLGRRPIKGYATDITIFRLDGLASDSGAGLFVGRQSEVAQIEALLDLCVRGRGHVAVLRGEPGIGKSRLLSEASARARSHGFAVIQGQALDFGEANRRDPLAQIVDGLIRLAHPKGSDQPELDPAALARAGIVDPITAELLADITGRQPNRSATDWLRAMDATTRDRKRQAAIVALAGAVARTSPLLIIVEDAHWADRTSLDAISGLAAGAEDWPILIAMTTRIDSDPLDADWRAGLKATPLTVFDLRALRTDDCLTLARHTLGDNETLARLCVDRAEGNPLFLDQILRYARDALSEAVPASIKSLVLSRLDQLSPADRGQVQAASLLGQRADRAALAHVLGQPVAALDEPARRGILRHTGDGLVFSHALVRDAIYESLLPSERRRLHERAATWFETRDRGQQALHLERAGNPAAADALILAAREAQDRFEPARALDHVDRALALSQAKAVRRAALSIRGNALLDLGRAQQAAAAFRDLQALADGEAERATALVGLASALRITDHYDEAFQSLDAAEPLAASAGDQAALARIHTLRGNLHFPLGHLERCLDAHESALAAAERAKSPDAEAQALGGLGDAEYARGRMMTACGYFSRCIEKASAARAVRIAASNRPMLAITLILANDLAKALAEAEAAIETAQRIGHFRAELVARHAAYWALAEMARYDEALPHVHRAQEITRILGAARFEPENLCFLGHVYARTARIDEARRSAELALARCRETGMAYIGPTVLGLCASVSDDAAARASMMAEAETILAAGSPGHNHFWFHRDAIEIGLDTHEPDLVERNAAALETFTAAEPVPWANFIIARGRALAAAQNQSSGANRAVLERLIAEAGMARLAWALPRLESALAR